MQSSREVTIVWLRHGEKAYDNSKGPPMSLAHDPGLVESAGAVIREKASLLEKTYGTPHLCVTSPYLRTRETAKILVATVEGKRPEIRIDRRVGEFLGFQKWRKDPSTGYLTRKPSVAPETEQYRPPLIGEKKRELLNRCAAHLKDLDLERLTASEGPSLVIWIVSHGSVMDQIRRLLFDSAPSKKVGVTGGFLYRSDKDGIQCIEH